MKKTIPKFENRYDKVGLGNTEETPKDSRVRFSVEKSMNMMSLVLFFS